MQDEIIIYAKLRNNVELITCNIRISVVLVGGVEVRVYMNSFHNYWTK